MKSSFVLIALAACGPREPARPQGLDAPSPYMELEVPGHVPAVVSLPLGATSKRPVIVATHGAGDRGEYHCELWRRIVENRAFVLCPQGRRMNDGVSHEESYYFYPDHFKLEREVLDALAALEQRFPKYVDASAAMYTGFSQGAIQGALVLVLHPDVFPRALLVEGGHGSYKEWSPYAARKYKDGGGKRVMFACGSHYCVDSARRSARYLDKVGVATNIAHAQGAGHSYGETMETELKKTWEWVVEDDPRWKE